MMNRKSPGSAGKLTLDKAVSYTITVQGALGQGWNEWMDSIEMTIVRETNDYSISSLSAILDQAALQGLLRRLYSLGLPLIEVHWNQDADNNLK